MHYHWNVSNRISPMRSFKIPVGENPSITIVRPLGGKSRGGQKLIDEDTYKWDGTAYVYDWEPLKKQIDTVRKRAAIHQILIDNPPWAFQRGLAINEEDRVETYGNAWPPNDPAAWSRYIQAMLEGLVSTYGKDQVEQWRYCIGREIGTKGHWRGTMLEFFEHYRITERAIHSVLPNAKVGTHFLWATSKNSFGPDFVKWCKQNDVRYDFIGVSYYPFYDKLNRVDLDYVYKADFAPIKDIPEWNPSATLEIHEFALISKMSSEGNSFDNAPRDHQESFTVMLAKMMYEHDMIDIFRWGDGSDKLAEQSFLSMEKNRYYKSSKLGDPTHEGNMVDAVFAHDELKNQYNIIMANYNAAPKSKGVEPIRVKTTLPVSPGTAMRFRNAIYSDGRLDWSEWNTVKTTPKLGSASSEVEIRVQLKSFSFQKIEISPLENSKAAATITRTITERKTGVTAEVRLIDVRGGKLICLEGDRQLEIPISVLSEKDVEFLREWMKTR